MHTCVVKLPGPGRLMSVRLCAGLLPLLLLCLPVGSQAASETKAEIREKPRTRSFADRHKIEIDGLLMFDIANVGGLYTDNGRSNETDVRRARLGMSGNITKRTSAGITLDLDGGDPAIDLQEVLLRFKPKKNHRIDLGLIKQPFGLENSTSSRRLSTLERSMATNAFAPDRAHGLAWSTTPSNHFIGIGVFADTDIDNVYDVSGRATFAPVKKKQSVLHFGVNASYRDNDSTEFRIRDSGILQDGSNFFKSGKYSPEDIVTLGVEAAWAHKSFSVKSEWFRQSLALADDAESGDPSFTGGYIKLGYILNGKQRKYSNGKFGKVGGTKKSPAIEVVANLGQLNTIFEDKGDDATELTLGLNYRINGNVRVSGQAQRLRTTDADGDKDSGTSVLLRLQIDFEAKPGRS